MTSDIRPELVDAVAEALSPVVPNSGGVIWEFTHEDGQVEPVTLRDAARVALAAVVPAIQAEALRDAADEWERVDAEGDKMQSEVWDKAPDALQVLCAWEDEYGEAPTSPGTAWLRGRADALDGGGDE